MMPDLRGSLDYRTPPVGERLVGDELADCLQRFLTASADERTLQRAAQALTRWRELSEK